MGSAALRARISVLALLLGSCGARTPLDASDDGESGTAGAAGGGGASAGGGGAGGFGAGSLDGGNGPGSGNGGSSWPSNGLYYWVDDDDATCGGHAPCFPTITDAAVAAPAGTTIMVRAGRHPGAYLRDKTLRIMSESGPEATTVVGRSSYDSCFIAQDSTVWISGFTLRSCGKQNDLVYQGFGVFLGGFKTVRAHIEGNVIENNDRGGIEIDSGTVEFRADVEIVGNRIVGNRGIEGGLHVGLHATVPDHGRVLIANNVIASNSVGIGFASIGPLFTPDPMSDLFFEIVNNTVVANETGIAAETWNLTLANNIVFGNVTQELSRFWTFSTNRAFSNLLGDGQFIGWEGNFVADPLFVDPSRRDYHLLGGSPAIRRAAASRAPSTDFDGRPRAGAPSVGAFEPTDRADVPPVRCGDGVLSTGGVSWLDVVRMAYETCEDGNAVPGDGCNDLCQWEPRRLGPAPRPGLIGAFAQNVCVVRSNESVVCWGTDFTSPPPGPFVAVAVSNAQACAIHEEGTLACWNNLDRAAWVPEGTYKHIVSDDTTMCALATGGDVTCWAYRSSAAPTRYAGPFIDFSVSRGVACGLGPSGEVTCVGSKVPAPVGSFLQVVAAATPCALASDGSPVCWPTQPMPSGAYLRLSIDDALRRKYCALRPHGGMTCWDETGTTLQHSPHQGFMDLAPNGVPCGLYPDRRVDCWGISTTNVPHE